MGTSPTDEEHGWTMAYRQHTRHDDGTTTVELCVVNFGLGAETHQMVLPEGATFTDYEQFSGFATEFLRRLKARWVQNVEQRQDLQEM